MRKMALRERSGGVGVTATVLHARLLRVRIDLFAPATAYTSLSQGDRYIKIFRRIGKEREQIRLRMRRSR